MRLYALFSIFVCVAACDSAPDVRPVSAFPSEEPAARSIFGVVFRGTEPVPAALVVVDAAPVLASDAVLAATLDPALFPRTTAADPAGRFRVYFAPFFYDLSVRDGRDVFVFRELSSRFFAPPLGADAPVHGFTARLAVTTTPPPQAGNAVAFFVNGDDARSLTAIEPRTFDVAFRSFDTTVRLQAVEYVASSGLAVAVAAGEVDIRVINGTVVSAAVPMQPVTSKVTVTFDAAAPPGFALAPLEVEMDFGLRTSARSVTQLAAGAPLEISVVPNARYAVRARATSSGAISSSGRVVFDPSAKKVSLVMPGPVEAEAPIDDSSEPLRRPSDSTPQGILDPNGPLAVRFSAGVVEHALVPASGDGATIRVATESRATVLPDVTRFGLGRPTGRYAWTIEHFAKLEHIDKLSGEDARVASASWKSAPRIIVLR